MRKGNGILNMISRYRPENFTSFCLTQTKSISERITHSGFCVSANAILLFKNGEGNHKHNKLLQ